MMHNTMDDYVLPLLVGSAIVNITFDLWMLKADFDTFTLVNLDWGP